MNPTFSAQVLIGVSAAYFIWPGGPVPRVNHHVVASAWSSLSKLPWSSASSSTNSRLPYEKDRSSAGGFRNSSIVSLEDVLPNSTTSVSAKFSQDGLESFSDQTYAVMLFVVLGVFGLVLWVWLARWMAIDTQVRQSVEEKKIGPVKKVLASVKILLSPIADKSLIPVKGSFVSVQQTFDPVVKKVIYPIKKVFSPFITISLNPVKRFFALVKAVNILVLNETFGPTKGMQEGEAAMVKAIIDERIEQLQISVDGLKKNCGTLEKRGEQIQQQLNRFSSRIESINQWQRESEFYFMRPNETRGRRADEEA
ncbi:predicted protein [Aspergillus nidulans FGSC A4]|jgi:hypothetical protein|uniref:Uncharacterized protein n=1 Tax=Emericella nidulans (strain FGSC A4 / ATCC 38163 / CBS 112.46 / NRRL 194 / M139) TaxID=227321 RepID=Q5B4H6_EMENI|nr:hypothetical protein [Aspergillus nidulans FGSC A4]EAA60897.1 predicted protein [Aspergillus nidulans FGSC A4]CBF77267.1 TPA: conserved hypothetical protein [Aspergillus nidulans FGSC A4]|eukprot:XP_662158.1 predicted protein [Aspergillus nidulans FGSC A4]